MDKNQLLRNLAATEEEERYAREDAKRRAQREKKQKAYDNGHSEDAAVWMWMKIIFFALIGLVLLWGYYGPIVRDAIYGVGS